MKLAQMLAAKTSRATLPVHFPTEERMPRLRVYAALVCCLLLGVSRSSATTSSEHHRSPLRESIPESSEDRIARMSAFLCELHPAMRWKRGREWNQEVCDEVATAYVRNGEKTGIHDLLGLATGINESDTVDTAIRVRKDGSTDSGLMGIHCPSPFTRGIKCEDVRKIPTNVSVGFAILSYIKGGGVTRTVIVKKNKRPVLERRSCDHEEEGHEFWLHYNAGYAVPKKKFSAKYDQRVGAIYLALCRVFGEEPREIQMDRSYDARKQDRRTRDIARIITTLSWQDPTKPRILTDAIKQ